MPITTTITQSLEISHPVLLAPMAGISGGALAAAVTQAGGLGLIGAGYGDRTWLERELAVAGNARIGVGFIAWALERQPELLELALDHDPVAIFLSFGDFNLFALRVARSNSRLIVQIQSLEQAKRAIDCGADIIVAQGTEAGGHGGKRATLPLVPAIVDIAGKIPVVAAGGIADGRGLAAALMLGAGGVLCGTAFFASHEALSHVSAKSAAISASGDWTARSSVFDVARGLAWPPDWNLRTLRNGFLDAWSGNLDGLEARDQAERALYAAAVAKGDFDVAAVIVGEGVDLVVRSESAGDIVQRMVADGERLLATAGAFVVEGSRLSTPGL